MNLICTELYNASTKVKTSLFLFFISFASLAKESSIKSTREIFFSTQFESQIKNDFPIVGMHIVGNEVWMAGKKDLWQWNMAIKKGRHIRLAEPEDKSSFQTFTAIKNYIWIANNQSLLSIRLHPLEVHRFHAAEKMPSLHITNNQNSVLWIRQNQILQMSKSEQNIVSDAKININHIPDHLDYDHNRKTLWFTKEKSIYKVKKSKVEKVLSLRQAIRKLVINQAKNILVHTTFSVLVLDFNGQIIQTIPVMNKRKIVLMSINNTAHSFLYSDRILETKFLQNKSTAYFSINPGHVKYARNLKTTHSHIGFIADGLPKLFQLESY